jgi:hypothetical protein
MDPEDALRCLQETGSLCHKNLCRCTGLKMEMACSSETLVSVYMSTLHYNLEN